MKQVIPIIKSPVLFAVSTDYWPISGQSGLSSTFGVNAGAVNVPWACTFRNISIYCKHGNRTLPITLTLRKNGVATALSVTLPVDQDYATTTGVAVAFEALDAVDYKVTASAGQNVTASFCVEHDGPGNFYGLAAGFANLDPGLGFFGGCFGNGGQEGYSGSEAYSGSASIAAIPGRITHLALGANFSGPLPSGGSYTAYIKKNGVLQDGSGGTVNTAVALPDTGARVVLGTFSLPVSLADVCDVVYVRNDTSTSGNGLQVSVGIGFTPDDDGWFMLTGGRNAVTAGATSYIWQGGVGSATEALMTVPIGPVGIRARGIYVFAGSFNLGGVGPGSGQTYTHTLLQGTAEPYVAGAETTVEVSMADSTFIGSINGLDVLFPAGSTAVIRNVPSASAVAEAMSWGLAATFPDVEDEESVGNGIIGPLIWVVINRVRQPSGDLSADAFSDLEMQDPSTYYGSYKQPFLLHAGDAERALSDPLTGDPVSSTFRFVLGDQDEEAGDGFGRLRAQLASDIDRYWTRPAWFFCTTRANRAELGAPFTAFAGHIVDIQPASPRTLEITLGDLLTERIVNDKLLIPWRLIRDGFLNQLDAVSDRLDLEQPEPIIYGEHSRTAAGSPEIDTVGFQFEPPYLGVQTVNGTERHVWLVAGHACKEVRVFVDGEEQTEADGWLIPGQSGWNAIFGAPYVDKVSSTFGTTRRYTLVYGTFGGGSRPFGRLRSSDADSVAVGDKVLTVAVKGIEDVGDGSGTLITDFYEQYKHFTVNFLANAGPDSYHSGAWLDTPQWSNPNGTIVDVVSESSFDAVAAIAAERFPGSPGLLIGAIQIGVRAADRSSPSRWIADFNRCGFCQSGPVEPFQWGITTIYPTSAAKAAAPSYIDAYEIIEGSFGTAFDFDRHATHFPWRTDFEQTTGNWKTSGEVESIEADYYERKEAPVRLYPFIPGQQGEWLATLEARVRANPPRTIRLDAPIGPDPNDDSLAYRNPGDYITYQHLDAVSETYALRLAQVQRVGVRGSARRSYIYALDLEQLTDVVTLVGEEGGEGSPGDVGSPVEGSPGGVADVGSPVDEFTYYVSTSGDDSNDGLTVGTAWRTITKAKNTATAGQSVGIRGGVYAEEIQMYGGNSGTSYSNAITFQAYNNEAVIIRPSSGDFVLSARGSSSGATDAPRYIIWIGITFDGRNVNHDVVKITAWDAGTVPANAPAHHFRFQNCRFTSQRNLNHFQQGILITWQSEGCQILDCEIDNVGDEDTSPNSQGIYGAVSDLLIDGCVIHDIYGFGISNLSSHAGQHGTNHTVSNNIIYNCSGGINEGEGSGHLVFNNLCYNNNEPLPSGGEGRGIFIGNENSTGTKVYNNTCYGNNTAGIEIDGGQTSTIIKNNICYGNGTNFIDLGISTTTANNLFGTNPLFVNPAGADFRLQAASPAINTGATLAEVTTDIRGIARPQGAAYDIGCYEAEV